MASDVSSPAPAVPADSDRQGAKPSRPKRQSTKPQAAKRQATKPRAAKQPGAQVAPLALYRRYRPATFAEVKGQEHVTEPLRRALRSGRVHHAYLFSGPRGCGKTSSARILARSLNCEQGPTPDPCGVCVSCIALAPSGPGSIDVIEIDAASHGGVDDARDLRERAFYAPVGGRFKIYIVDEAHMVTREGFNALLKLVEEPPQHLKFVFATTEPEKVIATIRSRTHHYPFRLMAPLVLRGLLEEILAGEGVAYEPAVLPVVIRASAGSARDALSVLDQLLAGSDESGLTYERAVALLGYTDDSLLDEVTDAFASGDGAAVFRAVERVLQGGHDPRRFATDLLDRFRDLILLAAVPDAADSGLLDVAPDRLETLGAQAGRFGQAELALAAETINAGLTEMRGATSPRLLLELMCAQVLLPSSAGGEKALLARVERLERRLAAGSVSGAGTVSGADSVSATVRTSGVADARATSGAAGPGSGSVAGVRGVSTGSLRIDERPRSAAPSDPEPVSPGRSAEPPSPGRSAESGAPGNSASPPKPPSPASPASRPGSGSADADVLRERWAEILEAVRRERKVAWILLSNTTVDSLVDGVLTLRFAREGEARGFSASGYDQDLGRVLDQMLGIIPRIRAVAGPGQAGTGQIGPGQAGTGQIGPGQAGTGQIGPGQAGSWQGGSPQGGSQQGGSQQGGSQQGGPRQGAESPRGISPDSGGRRQARQNPAGPAARPYPPEADVPDDTRDSAPGSAGRQPGWVPGNDQGGGPGASMDAAPLTGMGLIERELGGQIIEEFGDD